MNTCPRITEIPAGDDLCWYQDDECRDHADSLEEWITQRRDSRGGVEPGMIVFVADRLRPNASHFVPDYDQIIDLIANDAYDQGDEHADGYPEIKDPATAKADFESMIDAWAKKYLPEPTWWLCENVREYAITQADIDRAMGATTEN